MATTTHTCPFCNAQFPAAGPSEPRVCPRCHEPLPGHEGTAGADAPGATPAPRRSNRSVATVLGLIILGMGGVALAYALWTVAFRRGNDPRESTRVEVVAPAELRGLGYVPSGINILVGIHVGELMQSSEGRELVYRLRLPGGNASLEGIEQWLGMPLSEVDHVIFGFQTEAIAFPPTLIFLQTRKPIDTAKMVEYFKGTGAQPMGNKKYHLIRLPGLGLECALWFTSDNYRAILYAPMGSLGDVPDQPHPGTDHLAPHVRQFLREQKKGTQLWLHGRVEDWEKTLLPLVVNNLNLPGVPKKELQLVLKLRQLDLALQLGDGLRVSTRVEGKDAEAAKDLAGFVQGIWIGGRAFGGSPEMQSLSQELEKNRKVEQQDAVLTLETTASAEAVRTAFQPRPQEPEKKP